MKLANFRKFKNVIPANPAYAGVNGQNPANAGGIQKEMRLWNVKNVERF